MVEGWAGGRQCVVKVWIRAEVSENGEGLWDGRYAGEWMCGRLMGLRRARGKVLILVSMNSVKRG